MKKKVLIAVIIIAVAAAVIGIAVSGSGYKTDEADTEELFRQNILTIAYKNTIETAIPQTDLYNTIKEHFSSELPEGKTEKKAIVIGYDGCRADILKEMQNENGAVAAMLKDGASLNLAYCGGVNFPEENTQDTSTAPGWCSILTGVWADKHGITANDITKKLEYKTLLTTLTEEGVIDSASFNTKWAGHFSRNNATYLLEKDYCEENGLNVSFNKLKNDKKTFEFTIEEIKEEDCSDFIFVIYEPTDGTGHSKGFSFNNPKYKEAFKEADSYGYETIEAIKARETYEKEDWLIIITSDHGGIGTGHGGESIQERMTFIVINKEI